MNYVNYVLSSVQIASTPSVLNHYLFTDPVYGTAITYPNSANGYIFNVLNTFVFSETANGGMLFPWGYPVDNTKLSADLGFFKGQCTFTVIPSGIDTTYYTVLKIIYDFDDNDIVDIEKGIVQNILPGNVAFLDNGVPTDVNVSHVYTARSPERTTYYPTVTVLNGNMALNIFSFKLTLLPGTVYDYDDFHIVNSAQLTRYDTPEFKSLEVFEFNEASDNRNRLTNFLLTSAYPTPTPSLTPYPTPTPSITPTPTVTPTPTNTPV